MFLWMKAGEAECEKKPELNKIKNWLNQQTISWYKNSNDETAYDACTEKWSRIAKW